MHFLVHRLLLVHFFICRLCFKWLLHTTRNPPLWRIFHIPFIVRRVTFATLSRVFYIDLLLSTAVGALLFLLVLVGAIHELPAVFTLPTDVGRIINQVYGYDSAEGFHFLLVQKTKQKSTLKTYGLKKPLMPTHSQ